MDEKSLCSRKLWFRHYYQYHPFPSPHLRGLEVHINGIWSITIQITKFKILISYSGNHYSKLVSSIIFTCHPFQPSPISLPKVIYFISSPFDIKLQKIVLTPHRLAAFRSQCQWIRIFVFNCSVRTCARHKNV